MIQEIVIEWTYEPEDYFEERIVILRDGLKLTVDSGQAQVRIDLIHIKNVDALIDELNSNLESRFLGAQVLKHEPFKLSEPTRYDIKEDGTKNYYLKAKSGSLKFSGGKIDFRLSNAKGDVIADTKRERLDVRRCFTDAVAKHRPNDKALSQMLKSYDAAVTDPNNELVHLYEIRDTISKRFGSDAEARGKLSLSKKEWRVFGKLTNFEPLKQGRHRGQNFDSLRNAESHELDEARKFAVKIIVNYLHYLESQGS